MMTRAHFERMNGFSNAYWSWGGEDEDSYNRVVLNGLIPWRQPPTIARYRMIPHPPSPKEGYVGQERVGFVVWMKVHILDDGLNTLKYSGTTINHLALYTHIVVDLQRSSDREFQKEYRVRMN